MREMKRSFRRPFTEAGVLCPFFSPSRSISPEIKRLDFDPNSSAGLPAPRRPLTLPWRPPSTDGSFSFSVPPARAPDALEFRGDQLFSIGVRPERCSTSIPPISSAKHYGKELILSGLRGAGRPTELHSSEKSVEPGRQKFGGQKGNYNLRS